MSALSFTGELGSCVLGRKPCRGAVPSHPVMRAPLPRWAALTGFPHHPLVLLPLFLYCFLGPAVVCLWHGPLRAPGWAESGRDSMENVVWPPPGSEPCPQLRGWGSWAGRRSVRPDMGIHTWPLSKAGAVPGGSPSFRLGSHSSEVGCSPPPLRPLLLLPSPVHPTPLCLPSDHLCGVHAGSWCQDLLWGAQAVT